MKPDKIIVKPGQVIDRATGNIAEFQSLPISPTETVNRGEPGWEAAVEQNCGTQSRTFLKQEDNTYRRE
jgi:hypothetical protein